MKTTVVTANNGYKYWAFVSYSHEDARWANWLHASLEGYRVPKRLVGRASVDGAIPRRIFPVFRDKEELSTSSDLGETIRQALKSSRYLVVICSPAAAQSRWVNEEIAEFIRLGRRNRILCLVTDEEKKVASDISTSFSTPFPSALHNESKYSSSPSSPYSEPLAADVRPNADGKRNALLKIIAGLIDTDFNEIVRREKQRQRTQISYGILAVTIAVASLTVAYNEYIDVAKEKDHARLIRMSDELVRLGKARLGALLALEARRMLPKRTDFRHVASSEIALINAVYELRQRAILTTIKGEVNDATLHPLGHRIVTATNEGAQIWDTATTRRIRSLPGLHGSILSAVYSRDGRWIATAAPNGEVKVWNADTGELITTLIGHKKHVWVVKFANDGTRVMTASADGTIRTWNATTGKSIAVIKDTFLGGIFLNKTVDISPDGSRVAATSNKTLTARIWNASTGKSVKNLSREGLAFLGFMVTSVRFSPDGKQIVTGGTDGTARIWDSHSGGMIKVLGRPGALPGSASIVYDVAFSPDGSRILTANSDNMARIWDTKSGNLLNTLKGHSDAVRQASFSANGHSIVTISQDGTIRLWEAASGRQLAIFAERTDAYDRVSLSANGQLVAIKLDDGTIRVWDTTVNTRIINVLRHRHRIHSAKFDSKGKRIVTASLDGWVRTWDGNTGSPLELATRYALFPLNAQFSPDDKYLLVTAKYQDPQILDPVSGKRIATLPGHEGRNVIAFFSFDGEHIITTARNFKTRVWEIRTGRSIQTPANKIIKNENKNIAIEKIDKKNTRLYDPNKNKSFFLKYNSKYITKAVFSPDHKIVATALKDNSVAIWHADSGIRILLLRGHRDEVTSIEFSPDGSRLLTGSDDGTARLWQILPIGAALIDHVENLFPRGLTPEERLRFDLSPIRRAARQPQRIVSPNTTASRKIENQGTFGSVVPSSINDCDRKSAHPDDVDAKVPGLRFNQIDAKAAVEACLQAVKSHPGVMRFRYQYGRALAKANLSYESAQWIEKAAEGGYAFAQLQIGNLYSNGDGVPKNKEKAAFWWRKAANKGIRNAQVNIGAALYIGEGVPKDFKEAVKWFHLAAQNGDAHAAFNLGLMFEYARNRLEARYWYEKAAKLGNKDADNALKRILNR